jgi:large subunit ribosomal protein L17
MAHQVFGTKLSRDTDQRQALLKGLVGALVRSEAIETTESKAKAVKGLMEDLVTKARRAALSDIRKIEEVITDKALVEKLVHDIAPRFKSRPGGYTRLIKLGNRVGDNAPMVRMEFVAAKLVEAAKIEAPAAEKPVKAAKATVKKAAVTKPAVKKTPARKTKKV